MIEDIRQIRREVRGVENHRFPKELEKQIQDMIDHRISSIFLLTLLLMFGSASLLSMKQWGSDYSEIEPVLSQGAVSSDGFRFSDKMPVIGFVDKLPTREQALAQIERQEAARKMQPGREELPTREAATSDRGAKPSRLEDLASEVGEDGILAVATALSEDGSSPYDDFYQQLSQGTTGLDVASIRAAASGPTVAPKSRNARNPISNGRRSHDDGIVVTTGNSGANSSFSVGRRGELRMAVDDMKITAGSGRRDPKRIAATIKRQRTAIEYCFERALRMHPNLRGRIDVQIKIAANGDIEDLRIITSSLNNPRMEQCMIRSVRRWRFAKVEQGSVVIRIPFVF